jgi:enoyl-CoA hydratase
LVTHCDLIVAARDAQFGYPIVRNMASPPSHMFSYLMGVQWTKDLLLTGDLIDGETAAKAGLVLWAVPPEELNSRVSALAHRIATVPPELLAINKSICEKALDAMGRLMVENLALEADAMAHKTPTMKQFFEVGKRHGFKAGLEAVNRPYAAT